MLGTTSKREAHEKGLLHKTVISEVIDARGRWLMVKQASDRQDAGQYVSPVGGHVQAGESDDDALKREADEEVGLRDFKYELVGMSRFERHVIGRHENHLFVMYKLYSDAEPKLNHESVSSRYFTEQELKDEMSAHPEAFGGAFHFVMETFFPHLKK